MNAIVRCRRCALPAGFPGANLDASGECAPCRNQPSPSRIRARRDALRRRFDELVARVRGRGAYDLLMAYSGGKDSSYTLTVLRREYDLSILAVSIDNGFFTDEVHRNMRAVVDALGIDHVLVRPRQRLLRPLFAACVERDLFAASTSTRASSVCTACIAVVKFVCLRRAIESCVPLVGYGWSPGQSPLNAALYRPTPSMLENMQKALLEPIRSVLGHEADAFFLEPDQLRDAAALPHLVSPLALFDYDERHIRRTLEPLGWRAPRGLDANSTNCRLNSLANHAHLSRHPFHPYTFELAGLVREGVLDRAEAIRRLEEAPDPAVVEAVRAELVS